LLFTLHCQTNDGWICLRAGGNIAPNYHN